MDGQNVEGGYNAAEDVKAVEEKAKA